MLTDAIAKIMAELGPLVRDSERSDVKKYRYLSANGIKTHLQPLLAKHGVAVGTEDVQISRSGNDVVVTCRFVLASGEDRLPIVSVGAAQLLTKSGAIQPEALASAQTRALVSALRGAFMVPEADDEHSRNALEATQEERIDPGLRERRRTAATVRQAMTAASRARGCPNREAVVALRDMVTGDDRCPDEGERDRLRAALQGAASGDWSAMRAECEDRGIAWATTEEAPPAKDTQGAQAAAEIPAVPNPRGNNPEQHRDYWAQALRKLGVEELSAVADKLAANPNAKASAAALSTIYQRLRAGDDVEAACVAGRDAFKEAS